MESLVLELQREAYEQNTPVSTLLRKTYTLARKLKVEELEKWANYELNGYKKKEDVPEYRIITGELKALNPLRGYIPAFFHKDLTKDLRELYTHSPITEIESLIRLGESNGNMLTYKFPPSLQVKLMKFMTYEMEVSLHFPVTHYIRILDLIRNIILEWTFKLEEQDVLGEGMTFSKEEKQKASQISITNIQTMINSQLQQNSDNSTQNLSIEEFKIEKLLPLIEDLKTFKSEITNEDLVEEITSETEVLQSQIKSPKPKKGIIKETLLSIRNIAEGTTGSLVATAIQDKVTHLLTMF